MYQYWFDQYEYWIAAAKIVEQPQAAIFAEKAERCIRIARTHL